VKFSHRVLHASFSTAQVARLTRITPRQLDYWDRKEFIRPSVSTADGYGSARRYSFRDLVKLRVAARLRSGGFGLAQIRQCVRSLERLDPSRAGIEEARLLLVGSRVLWVETDTEIVDLLHGGQLMLVLPVGEAVADMARAATSLFAEPRALLLDEPPKRQRRRVGRR
jgi:DNA-binding transcriptional MerR regulator